MNFIGILLLVASCVVISSSEKDVYAWGFRSPSDVLLHKETISKESEFLRKVTQDFTYPAPDKYAPQLISFIQVHGEGDDVTIRNGGISSNYVTIHLKSKRNQGFNYNIEIYGR